MNNHNNNHYYYDSYYDYINDPRDNHPEVARLPYKYLIYISNMSHKRINPGVYDPQNRHGFFKINSYANFYCSNCFNEWTSNIVTIELWWNKGKKEFDVRMYGQKCKHCVRDFKKPNYIYNIYTIADRFIEVLTTNYYIRNNINFNYTLHEVNSSHEIENCQKCEMLGHACYN